MRKEILRIDNVSKSLDGVIYLDNINFYMLKGEIMGLIPINNHGKSTIIDLIYQNTPIDFGRVYFEEELVNHYKYSDLSYNSVYILEKETKLVEDLSVMDNIYILNNKFEDYIIKEKFIKNETNKLLKQLGLDIQTSQLVAKLTIYQKSIIELIKAVVSGAKLIILVEISNFIGLDELVSLQHLLRYYSSIGISFLYIGNHHEEIFHICNRVSLFENGRVVKILNSNEFSDEAMEPFTVNFHKDIKDISKSEKGDYFRFNNIITDNLNKANFYLNEGNCITILDIDNKGIQDIEQILKGRLRHHRGEIIINKKTINDISINNLLKLQITLIPENPVEHILFKNMTYLENLIFLVDYKLQKRLTKKNELENIREEYRMIVGNKVDEEEITNLDRKSLYELIYHRVLLFKPKVVFIAQPFSNADMYLRNHIINLINLLKDNGIGVIILAVNISDTLYVSNKILIMEEGKIVRSLDKDEFIKTNN